MEAIRKETAFLSQISCVEEANQSMAQGSTQICCVEDLKANQGMAQGSAKKSKRDSDSLYRHVAWPFQNADDDDL